MNTPKTQQESISEIKRQRTAKKNTVIVVALLLVALLIESGASNTPNGHPGARDLIGVGLTVIAFASLLWSLYVAHKQADERQQLIQLKATSLTFIAVLFGLVVAQMLEALTLVKLRISIQIVVIGGILLWVGLQRVVEHRSK